MVYAWLDSQTISQMAEWVFDIHSNQLECEEPASLMGPGVGYAGTQHSAYGRRRRT